MLCQLINSAALHRGTNLGVSEKCANFTSLPRYLLCLAQYQTAIVKDSCLAMLTNNKYPSNLLKHKRLTVEAHVICGHFMEWSSTSTWNLQATSPSSAVAHNASLKKRAGVVCVEILFHHWVLFDHRIFDQLFVWRVLDSLGFGTLHTGKFWQPF